LLLELYDLRNNSGSLPIFAAIRRAAGQSLAARSLGCLSGRNRRAISPWYYSANVSGRRDTSDTKSPVRDILRIPKLISVAIYHRKVEEGAGGRLIAL
jgi:hypothetical protein